MVGEDKIPGGNLEVVVRHTDEVPCIVKQNGDEIEAILHPMLSNNQMAKVCFEDGSYRDVFWNRIIQLGVAEVMDEYAYGEEE